MTVSAIMGSLHDYASSRPAEVLAHLNRVLHGRMDGFVTCCAAHIAADGTMTVANAGNPAPYLNGEEMAVEPGLPLGILGEASYAETRYQIAPNDRLTLSRMAWLRRPTRKENSTALSAPRPSATNQRRLSRKQPPSLAKRTTLRSFP